MRISRNQIITISRGDTFDYPLFINAGTKVNPIRYKVKDTDEIYFGVMEPEKPFEKSIIRKKYESGNWQKTDCGDVKVQLEPRETRYLMPGTYYFEVKLRSERPEDKKVIQTLITRRKFVIL